MTSTLAQEPDWTSVVCVAEEETRAGETEVKVLFGSTRLVPVSVLCLVEEVTYYCSTFVLILSQRRRSTLVFVMQQEDLRT